MEKNWRENGKIKYKRPYVDTVFVVFDNECKVQKSYFDNDAMLHNTEPFLSVCLIVKNESSMLADCIASLRPLEAECPVEYIVVDTGSQDGTQDIARSLGCNLYETQWQNDFARARNTALQFATGTWIISIDADERLLHPQTLLSEIRQAMPAIGGFVVGLHSESVRSNGITDEYTAQATRIFRRDAKIQWRGIIHEQITDAIIEAGYEIHATPIVFHHLGYNLSPEAMRTKQDRNLSLLNTVIQSAPQDRYAHFQRGKTYLALGQSAKAIEDFQSAIDDVLHTLHAPASSHYVRSSAPPLAEHLIIETLNFYALTLYQTQQLDMALWIVKESLRRKKDQRLALLIAGDILLAQSDFRSALTMFEHIHSILATPYTGLESEYHVAPAQIYFKMGQCYTGMHDWQRALLCFHEGRKYAPYDVGCMVGEANIAVRLDRPQKARDLIKEAMTHHPANTDLPVFLSQVEHLLHSDNIATSTTVSDSQTSHTIMLSGAMIMGILSDADTPYIKQAITSLASCCDEIVMSMNAPEHEPTTHALLHRILDEVRSTIPNLPHIRLVQTTWKNDYSHARNHAIEHCRGAWILMLDTDEWFDQKTADHIRTVVQTAPVTVGGYISHIRHTATGAISDAHTQTEILRLFRRHTAIRYEGIIHEQVTAGIARLGLSILVDDVVVFYHKSTLPTGDKFLRYRHLLEAEMMRQGADNDEAAFQYALHVLSFGEHLTNDDMLNAISKILTHPKAQPQKCAITLNIYARHLLVSSDYERLHIVARQSLAYFPNQREALWYDVLASYKTARYRDCAERLGLLTAYMQTLDPQRATMMLERLPIPKDVIEILVHAFPSDDPTPDHTLVRARLAEFAQAFGVSLYPQTDTQKTISDRTRPLISLSMIVKNEEHFLRGCLQSVRGIVDEIIITDTGSTDATLAIAKEFGAKIYHKEWTHNFAEARNHSLQYCTGEWILYLDADERLIPEQGAGIRRIVESAEAHIGAYLCIIRSKHRQSDVDTEHHVGAYPRLFRNYGYPTIQFIGRVHEQISTSILQAGGGIAESDILIEHLGYDQDMAVMQQKTQRNYQLLMQHVQEEPQNSYAWLQLGLTLNFMLIFDQAEQALRFALQIGDLPKHLAASASATLSNLIGNQGKYEESLRFAEISLQNAPEQVYARHLRAYALLYLQRWEEAEVAFMEILHRLDTVRSAVRTGFDIAIPRSSVEDGIKKARAHTTQL